MSTIVNFTFVVMLYAILRLTGTVMADTIDTTGQEPYEQCGYCHEYDGNATMPGFPRLAGQNKAYLRKQLREFKSGKRKGQMQATAELLSDRDIEVVADYFSMQRARLKNIPEQSKADGLRAANIYRFGLEENGITACISCHGANAMGKGMYPRLAGQDKTYLLKQLAAFKQTNRNNDPGGQMRTVVRNLSDRDMDILAAYLAGLVEGSAVQESALRRSASDFEKSKNNLIKQ